MQSNTKPFGVATHPSCGSLRRYALPTVGTGQSVPFRQHAYPTTTDTALVCFLADIFDRVYKALYYINHELNVGKEFKRDRVSFLTKLYEMCKYNTKIPVDAFEVGRQLGFDEAKTGSTVNYLLEKTLVRKSESIPISTGDPRPQQNFLIIFITSKGIDELDEQERPSVADIHQHYGNTYQITDVNKSNIQIGTQGSSQLSTININDAKNKELAEILNQLKNNLSALQPEQTVEIQSDIAKIQNELTSANHDENRLEHAIGSLYDKIKDVIPLLGIAMQLANWFKPT
ncbi:MAG: hypothetical protein WA667_17600 [Candidatus Nitrosopolaris sp.]